ncbi:MAG: hypothetical protein AVDCRST_MAG59-4711 [uncultured Thermomicrobiales bacterium]|uniref:Uncharacterized protein n=1 Tax=uncultured Thermomicrobiales bacterium TaxID=1645740 RepID=A0A6J4VIV2_9BACT|nr:MAG: hypothetical protein AVDCRST_MAG59-4711 [uncultured Thermomicrobiales bacterium]
MSERCGGSRGERGHWCGRITDQRSPRRLEPRSPRAGRLDCRQDNEGLVSGNGLKRILVVNDT